MSFDIPLHIPDNSPEARIIEAIVLRDHVSPEEVVRRALRELTVAHTAKRPSTTKRKAHAVAPITESELKQIKTLFPGPKCTR